MQVYYITRTGFKDGFSSTFALYVDSSTVCGFFLSWHGAPPQYHERSAWGHVGFYRIHTFLNPSVESQFRIISKSYKNSFGATTQPLFPSLNSHFSQVRVGMLLFLFLSCCISSLGRKTYCTINRF